MKTTYFKTRNAMRAAAKETGGKCVDKGADSAKGKRWAVVTKAQVKAKTAPSTPKGDPRWAVNTPAQEKPAKPSKMETPAGKKDNTAKPSKTENTNTPAGKKDNTAKPKAPKKRELKSLGGVKMPVLPTKVAQGMYLTMKNYDKFIKAFMATGKSEAYAIKNWKLCVRYFDV